MSRIISEVIAGLVAGMGFVLLFLLLKYNIIISIIISIGLYLGLSIVLKPPKKAIRLEGTNLTDDEWQKMVFNGKQEVLDIRNRSRKITNVKVKGDVERVCDIADAIFDEFIKDPKDVKYARKFFDYYLETTRKVVGLYSELASKPVYSEKERDVLNKAERVLNQIEKIFHKQLAKLQEGDYLDLETELEVLEMTMKSEGI